MAVTLLRNAAFFLAGVALCLLGLARLPAYPTRINLERERALERRKDCEVLFVGPSYVKSQVLPDVFDARSAELGQPVTSCKFGATGLTGYEIFVQLDALLAEGWPRLRWLVIDVTLGGLPSFPEGNWFKPRMIQWHTLGALEMLARRYAPFDYPLEKRVRLARAHVAHVAANYFHLGEAAGLLEGVRVVQRLARAWTGESDRIEGTRASLRRRFARRARAKKRDKQYLSNAKKRKRHRHKVKRLRASKRREPPTYDKGDRLPASERIRNDQVLELRALVRGYGLEPCFLLAPIYRAAHPPAVTTRRDDPPLVMDFGDPDAYPELYKHNARGRTQHLNLVGSRHYSRLLADEVLKTCPGKP